MSGTLLHTVTVHLNWNTTSAHGICSGVLIKGCVAHIWFLLHIYNNAVWSQTWGGTAHWIYLLSTAHLLFWRLFTSTRTNRHLCCFLASCDEVYPRILEALVSFFGFFNFLFVTLLCSCSLHHRFQLTAIIMSFVQHFALREAGLGPRGKSHLNPVYSYLPDSCFQALQVNCHYRFTDSNDSHEAPPLTMTIAGDRLATTNDVGDIAILDKKNLTELTKFSAHRSAIFDFKWRGINGNDTGSSGMNVFPLCLLNSTKLIRLFNF